MYLFGWFEGQEHGYISQNQTITPQYYLLYCTVEL